MEKRLLQQGAEAKIILEQDVIIKDRIKKSYRLPEIDRKIRKTRTSAETKLMLKASKAINVPIPLVKKEKNKEDFVILMPLINGKKLSEYLDEFKIEKQKEICKKIGESVGKLHDSDIIHGDLTTSNMILKEGPYAKKQNNEFLVYFIDFGLGFVSKKAEDKAVDLHLLRQALEAKHFKNFTELWECIKVGYKNSKDYGIVLERLKAVEKRGRYKY